MPHPLDYPTKIPFARRPLRDRLRSSLLHVIAGLFLLAILYNILTPSLGRARESDNRPKCRSNLRQIGQALRAYAAANNNHFPPDIPTLLRTGHAPETLIFACPSSNAEKARGTTRPVEIEIDDPAHRSYPYYGANLTLAHPANTVLAADTADNHGGDGRHVLHLDGSVTFLPEPTFTNLPFPPPK